MRTSLFEKTSAEGRLGFGVPPSGGSHALPPEGGTPNQGFQTASKSMFEKSAGGVRPSRAQQREHCRGTRKVHAIRPSYIAAPGDGRTPSSPVAAAKASFQTAYKKTPTVLRLVAMLMATLALAGCQTVQPWQRKTLSDYTMRGDRDPLGQGDLDHIFFSREMSSGGKGVGGGGCGCN